VGVGPLVQKDSYEVLHLSAHPRRRRRRGLAPDAQPPEHSPETLGLEGSGVIRHHRPNPDAKVQVIAQRGKRKGHRSLLLLARFHLHVGQASMVVHRGKDVLPPRRTVPCALVTGDPVARPLKPGMLLGVQV